MIRPDFIIIGSMKSGTTSLYRWLSTHPDIGMSRDKETDYFVAEKSFARGPDWYAAQFTPGRKIYGEASPNYSKVDDFQGVPGRIRAALPDVRLIYLVRDPVTRFVSQYRHSWTMGDIAMSPHELPSTREYAHILNTSRYARQVEAYLAEFEADRLQIVDFDDLVGDPETTLDHLHRFLGAGVHRTPMVAVHNENSEMWRIPAPLLRFAQSPTGKSLARLFSRRARDQIRRMLALQKARQPPEFPASVLDRIRDDLSDDIARFRRITGRQFANWSV
jgi:hypothetical protein